MLPIIDFEEPEVWQQRKPKYADHIRVNRGLYYHHGIYVSNEEVIHFTGSEGDNILGTDNEVIKTDLSAFLKGSPVEVKIYNSEEREDLYSPNEIVSYARSCLGDTGYNLVFNNCEHFANMCTLGRFRSKQVENFIKPKGGKVMGIFSGIGSFIGNLFGGNKTRETITTTYEPDKVRVAEIESQTKLMLAKANIENTKIKHELQKDLLTHFVEVEKFIMHARKENYITLAQEIQRLGQTVAENHIQNIQLSNELSAEHTKKISDLYHDFEKKQTELLNDKLQTVEEIQNQRDNCEATDPIRKTYEKIHEQLLSQIVIQQNDAVLSLRAERDMQIRSNIQSNEALQKMLADNQVQYNQIIAKSQEFIGATNTYKALTNDPNNQNLLDNKQNLLDNEANNSHQIPHDETEDQDSVENNQEISNTEEIFYEN